MIRRFFADGLAWVVVAGLILGLAVYGLYFTAPTANPDLVTHVSGQYR